MRHLHMCRYHTRGHIPHRQCLCCCYPHSRSSVSAMQFPPTCSLSTWWDRLPHREAPTSHKGICVSLTLHHITYLCQTLSLTVRDFYRLQRRNVTHRNEYCIKLLNQQMHTHTQTRHSHVKSEPCNLHVVMFFKCLFLVNLIIVACSYRNLIVHQTAWLLHKSIRNINLIELQPMQVWGRLQPRTSSIRQYPTLSVEGWTNKW